MARKTDIQYIRYYTDGSAAKKIEPKLPGKRNKPITPRMPRTQYVLHVDLLAICGIAVAAVLLIMMAVGVVQLRAAQEQTRQYAQYVQQLEQTNHLLQAQYEAGYDLEDIRHQAELLGLVPVESVEQIELEIPEIQTAPKLTLWERICGFFRNW